MNDTNLEVMVVALVAEYEREFMNMSLVPHEEEDKRMAELAEKMLKAAYKNWLREHVTALARAYGDERERRVIERIVVAFAYQSNADMSATDVLKMIGEAARTSQAEDTKNV
jgi:hypothetical protein